MVEWENTVPEINCLQWQNAKMFLNAISFLKFSAIVITHLFVTVFVQKACIGIKDCVQFNCS